MIGHLDDILQGRPFDEIRFFFIPYVLDLVAKNSIIIYLLLIINHLIIKEMPALFLPGPLINKRVVVFMTDPVSVRVCYYSSFIFIDSIY